MAKSFLLLLMRSFIRKLEKMLVPIRLRLISVVTIREVKRFLIRFFLKTAA